MLAPHYRVFCFTAGNVWKWKFLCSLRLSAGPSGVRVVIGWPPTRERSLRNGRLARHWRPPVDKDGITSDRARLAAALCWLQSVWQRGGSADTERSKDFLYVLLIHNSRNREQDVSILNVFEYWMMPQGSFLIIKPLHIKDRIISKPYIYKCRHFCAAWLFIGYDIDVELKACQAELLLSAALQKRNNFSFIDRLYCLATESGTEWAGETPNNADITFPWALSNNHKLVNHDGKSLSHERERGTLANNRQCKLSRESWQVEVGGRGVW